MRGVTETEPYGYCAWGISTRTPHAGSDGAMATGWRKVDDFNPHSPCGE